MWWHFAAGRSTYSVRARISPGVRAGRRARLAPPRPQVGLELRDLVCGAGCQRAFQPCVVQSPANPQFAGLSNPVLPARRLAFPAVTISAPDLADLECHCALYSLPRANPARA